ncbi:MAG: hypothetical protein CMP10_15580 [Zetaproteobacteria bacterium]|nr:hypothetical protein [Pseudobdellovibrionaceae bacterium]
MSDQNLKLLQLKEKLSSHPLYKELTDIQAIRIYMEHHVICVWDFMSLLKSLQLKLTCVQVPWIPSDNNHLCRIINEIVLDEESDLLEDGVITNHFEMYLNAMKAIGCDTNPIEQLIQKIKDGIQIEQAIDTTNFPQQAKLFTYNTMNVCKQNLAAQISVFSYGRENVIPLMFQSIVEDISKANDRVTPLLNYLNRHIEIDSDNHGPQIEKALELIFQQNPEFRNEALEASIQAIQHRLHLWDATADAIRYNRRSQSTRVTQAISQPEHPQ